LEISQRIEGNGSLIQGIQEAVKPRKNTPSLKKVLRGQGCYRVVSKWETTLGVFGLMKESSDFSFLENFKREGSLPYPI
jgi:hypothetical protein